MSKSNKHGQEDEQISTQEEPFDNREMYTPLVTISVILIIVSVILIISAIFGLVHQDDLKEASSISSNTVIEVMEAG